MMTLCLVCCVLAVVLDAFALQIDRHWLWTRSGTYINHNDGRNEFWKSEPKPRHDTKVIILPSLAPNIIFRKCVCVKGGARVSMRGVSVPYIHGWKKAARETPREPEWKIHRQKPWPQANCEKQSSKAIFCPTPRLKGGTFDSSAFSVEAREHTLCVCGRYPILTSAT